MKMNVFFSDRFQHTGPSRKKIFIRTCSLCKYTSLLFFTYMLTNVIELIILNMRWLGQCECVARGGDVRHAGEPGAPGAGRGAVGAVHDPERHVRGPRRGDIRRPLLCQVHLRNARGGISNFVTSLCLFLIKFQGRNLSSQYKSSQVNIRFNRKSPHKG
jgi:hypothetical protein